MLCELLKAQRPDLLDGFPLKAVFKALSAPISHTAKLNKLNTLLADDCVKVVLSNETGFLMTGFRKAGIVAAKAFSGGDIEIKVNDQFFESTLSVLDRALRFQSITAHELVHRHQFSSETQHAEAFKADDELTSIQYLNDPYELEAMAAEVAHDTLTSKYASKGFAQPRFDDLTLNAKHFLPESMDKFRTAVKTMRAG